MKLENLRILRRPEVEKITGLKRSSIYAKMAEKTFPLTIKIGSRSVGWLESEIHEWLEKRISESREVSND